MNKKGLSPLVATVLLIAFAVSLGAMIINIRITPDSGALKDCTSVQIAENGPTGICLLGSGNLHVAVDNNGQYTLQGMNVNVHSGSVFDKKEFPGSIAIGDSFVENFAVSTEMTKVEVVPKIINDDGELEVCNEKKIVKAAIPSC
ncbi:MAG: hypothetical protein H6502_02915 [Candidatus Woesearchaeota archaeon]|nr:MAG: hypothetical protein H6502_02915 [Candidatus Woesearchaeota archaeon]